MADLSFDDAYQRLCSILIDAEIENVEKHGDVDSYGLPTGRKFASVTCYEPRLTNAVHLIGGWTFLIDNSFITTAVQKIAMMWLQHKGGVQYGEPALTRALRHCFKRFYAESLVALAKPPIGRAMLLESVVFEREFMASLFQHAAQESNPEETSRFNTLSYQVAKHGVLLCQRHEIGHILLAQTGEDILANTAKILDGSGLPLIKCLVEKGDHSLAEEVFCDLFAFNSIIQTEQYYLDASADACPSFYSALHLDDVRAAYFCYAVTMALSRVWFHALKDARANWDPADHGPSPTISTRLPLEEQASNRVWYVRHLVISYIHARKGDIHERHGNFYFSPASDNLIARASSNLDQLLDTDDMAAVGESEREIARYLVGAMTYSSDTSTFLINIPRYREWNDWRRLDDIPQHEPATTEEKAMRLPEEVRRAKIASDAFWMAMNGIYADYAKIFDAIVADILYNASPKEGTLERLEAFKAETLERIETYGSADPDFATLLAHGYVAAKRKSTALEVLEAHIILLTLMRRVHSHSADFPFEITVAKRLSHLEAFATRNCGANVAAFASLLIPEINTDRLTVTTLT